MSHNNKSFKQIDKLIKMRQITYFGLRSRSWLKKWKSHENI